MTPPVVQKVLSRMDMEQLKVPLGFIRLIELVFALIGYAALNGWQFSLLYTCTYKNSTSTKSSFSTNSLSIHDLNVTKCDNQTTAPLFDDTYGGGSGFFCFVLLVAVFFSLASLIIYLFCWGQYTSDDRPPIVDLSITTLLAFAFLLGTFIFARTVRRIEAATSEENVRKLLGEGNFCEGADVCDVKSYDMYAVLSVANIAGAASVLLWFANIWFVYKETGYFRSSAAGRGGGHGARNQPIQQDPYTLE